MLKKIYNYLVSLLLTVKSYTTKSNLVEQPIEANLELTTKLKKLVDKTNPNTSEGFMSELNDLGFDIVYEKRFDKHGMGTIETYYVMWHPILHILLNWETHCQKRNFVRMYYNIKCKEKFENGDIGQWMDFIIDNKRLLVRKGGKTITQSLGLSYALLHVLNNGGEFIPWVYPPTIYLLHSGDRDKTNSTEYVYHQLPQYVKDNIKITFK